MVRAARARGPLVRHGLCVAHCDSVADAAELMLRLADGGGAEGGALESFEQVLHGAGRWLALGRKATSEEVRRALAKEQPALAKRWASLRAGRRWAAHPDSGLLAEVCAVLDTDLEAVKEELEEKVKIMGGQADEDLFAKASMVRTPGKEKTGKAVQDTPNVQGKQKDFESIVNPILMQYSEAVKSLGKAPEDEQLRDKPAELEEKIEKAVQDVKLQLAQAEAKCGDLEKAQVELDLQLKEYMVELDGLKIEKVQTIDELQKKALLDDDLEAERARTRQAEGRAEELMQMLQEYKEVLDIVSEERKVSSSRAHGVGKGKHRREPC